VSVLAAHATRQSQGYTAFARAAIQLDRAGAAQARTTVENVLSSALRFLGYRRNVERSPGPSSLMEVLDGEAIARYVSFALSVRCVARRERAFSPSLLTQRPRRSGRKPSGVGADVSNLVALMTYLNTVVTVEERAAVEQLQARAWEHMFAAAAEALTRRAALSPLGARPPLRGAAEQPHRAARVGGGAGGQRRVG